MKLVNYGAGEITDRLIILTLKLLHAGDKEVKHFEDERNCLLAQIRTRTLNGSWFEQVLQLGAVNGALWEAEDDLRALRAQYSTGGKVTDIRFDMTAAVNLAFRIQDLNDQRAQVVEAINKQTGEWLGSEKS